MYEWRFQLKFGEKYEPDYGWTPYTDKRVQEGDIIRMQVFEYNLAFWINESYLGVAFTDPRLNGTNLFPVVWLGSSGDSVQILPGGKTF